MCPCSTRRVTFVDRSNFGSPHLSFFFFFKFVSLNDTFATLWFIYYSGKLNVSKFRNSGKWKKARARDVAQSENSFESIRRCWKSDDTTCRFQCNWKRMARRKTEVFKTRSIDRHEFPPRRREHVANIFLARGQAVYLHWSIERRKASETKKKTGISGRRGFARAERHRWRLFVVSVASYEKSKQPWGKTFPSGCSSTQTSLSKFGCRRMESNTA